MEFRILGPLEVRGEQGALALGGVKPRTVLAFLLLHANEPVSAESLALALWGEDAPAGAVKTVQVHVSRLRKALGGVDIVETTPAGYRLRVHQGELDAERFDRMVDDGRRALAGGDAEGAAALLREALSLWRGPPLAEFAYEPFAQTEIARLEEQRLAAIEARVDSELAAGWHASLVGELGQLVAANPTRERLVGQLMLALYRCGRQSDALEMYGRARHTLVAEIGVEPGTELRRLHEAILRHDVSLESQTAVADLPRELDPEGDPPLAGREAELAWLRGHWDRAVDGAGAVVAVTGPRGIGKSRLIAELAGIVHGHGAAALYAGGASGEAVRSAVRHARSAEHPTLLVVDDADRSGAGLLADLTEAVHQRPVLAIATADDADAMMQRNGAEVLVLEPLDTAAVRELAAQYSPSGPEGDEWIERLPHASGGVPSRAHRIAAEAARRTAERRVGAAASRAEAGRAELRSSEAALTGRIVDLQAAGERMTVLGSRDKPVVCPFKGLACFEVEDAPYFFGRERLVAELVARLVGAPLLGIVGPSGSGKSSVLRGGLLPALMNGVVPGSDTWRQVLIRPGDHPMDTWRSVAGERDRHGRWVIAVDQFEETFTACRDERERVAFIRELARAVVRPGGGIVVLAIRADYYGRCATYPELAALLAANHVLVGPMRRDELQRAVECPADRVGLRVDPELTTALVDDVVGEPGALPLLSTALLELWSRRDGRHLRLAAYEQTGGVRGAVARLAEDAYCRLEPRQQELARAVLMRLVAEGAEGAVERQRVSLAELETERREDVARVVDVLTDRRLLTVSDGTVEMAHEALLREWPRLARWIDEDRESLRILRSMTAAANEWDRLGRDESALYRGTRLTQANEWRAHRTVPPNTLEREFLDASNARRRSERAARRRRINLAFAGLICALAAISVVAVIALRHAREAERQRDIGASRELAVNAGGLLESDPGLSLAVALRALTRWDTPQARDAVRRAANAAYGTGVWQLNDDWLWAVRPSSDGRRVVTSGKDGTVRIWDVDRRRVESTIEAHRGEVQDASLSPDGLHVATAGSDDGTVTVADPDGGGRRVVLHLDGSGPTSPQPVGVQFSPDGRRLAVAVSDGTVRVVSVEDADQVTRLSGHWDFVNAASFSPDGTRLVTASEDATARIWDVSAATSRPLPHPAGVQSATFSPDGEHVATAGADGVLRIWNVVGGGGPMKIRLGRQPLFSVRYSPDGRRLVAAGGDGVVHVLDVRTASVIAALKGHRGKALSADFVAGGAVVSAGEDGTLRTWAAPPVTAIPAHLHSVSISPTGRFATGGQESGAVEIWDLASGTRRRLSAHSGPSFARFSSDGSRIGSASWDGEVRVLNPDGGRPRVVASDALAKYSVALDRDAGRIAFGGSDSNPSAVIVSLDDKREVVLKGHTEAIWDVDFSPDGAHVVTASEDGTARIWDAADGRLERVLRGHGEGLKRARYSADGKLVVTAGADGTARVWRVADGSARILRGHAGAVSSAAFNPRGDRVVTAGDDGTVRVWSAAGGSPLLVVTTHRYVALDAVFTPDGQRVVSVGQDGVLRVVSCEICGSFDAALRIARQRAHTNLSRADQERALPRDG